MGLDMYAYSVAKHPDNTNFSIAEEAKDSMDRDFAYWRKLNALHGWMEDLAVKKGFKGESFNCVPVRVDIEDLYHLLRDVNEGNIKPRGGFFFGSQDYDERDAEEIRDFIKRAIGEIVVDNREIYYNSWW